MTVDINNRTEYEVAVKYLKFNEKPNRMDELRADRMYFSTSRLFSQKLSNFSKIRGSDSGSIAVLECLVQDLKLRLAKWAIRKLKN